MLLIRLSGHSGAGKSRLLSALKKKGVIFRRPIMYTSREPREGEVHGRDYYFMSRGLIEGLSASAFLVGNVRNYAQAVDLAQLEHDLRSKDPVIVEIFHTRWPDLKNWLLNKFGSELKILSVFMSAISPEVISTMPLDLAKSKIREEITRILRERGKDSAKDIIQRADTAVTEIIDAVTKPELYDCVLHSAAEGTDFHDDWTSSTDARGHAAATIEYFLRLMER